MSALCWRMMRRQRCILDYSSEDDDDDDGYSFGLDDHW